MSAGRHFHSFGDSLMAKEKASQVVLINLDCLMLIPCCFSKNTDSLSVAPVRHPVVQISSELHVTARTEGENKGEQRRPLTSEKLQ